VPNPWRHLLCPQCFALLEPDREPFLILNNGADEFCCRCQQPTERPIYYRGKPDLFPCRGLHSRGIA
jgi:hypothetical protein